MQILKNIRAVLNKFSPFFKLKVMALIDKIKKTKPTPTPKPTPKISLKDNLDPNEITIILNLIKNTSFRGDNIETIYNMILKLQNQYTKLQK